MQPTMKLRWVERMEVLWKDPETQRCDGRTIKVLQQWWEETVYGCDTCGSTTVPTAQIKGDWKDVPIETD